MRHQEPTPSTDAPASTIASVAGVRNALAFESRFAAVTGEARDLTELFHALYYEAARIMDATVFLFAVYDEASETVQVVRQMDRGVEHPGGSFPLGKGFTSEVIRTGAPRLIRRWSADGPPVRLLYGTEADKLVAPQSGMVVPIVAGDRVIGVLSTQSYQPEAYDATDLLVLGGIALQAASAISRIRTTEQRALEHERRALQLEAVLATMTDALLIVDARGAIVQLNRAARELLHLDAASLVLGQPLEQQRLELWPQTARDIAGALVSVMEALRSGTSVAERQIELHCGVPRFLSVSASVLGSATGPQGGVIVFRDITAQCHLERLREDIFSMAWHDMQSPIAVIRGHAELLLRLLARGERNVAELAQAQAALIVRHTDRLAELLTMLFDVSCLEAGFLSISRSTADLAVIALEVTEGMRLVDRRQISLVASPGVVGQWDAGRIRQVLTNLVTNALKYSPDRSSVTVSVTTDRQSAVVTVRDHGIGLDESELAQLFQRGYRAEAARGIAGEGLGLYFSRGIVQAHGGRIWAESAGRGKGSTFSVALPLQEPT